MIAASRPLRFVVLLLGGWVAMRTAQLWPVAAPTPATGPGVAAMIAPSPRTTPSLRPLTGVAPSPSAATRIQPETGRIRLTTARPDRSVAAVPEPLVVPMLSDDGMTPIVDQPIGSPLTGATRAGSGPSRFSLSGWTIVRDGGAVTPFAPQLGGSQAGVRLTYVLSRSHRLSLAGRFSTALGARQGEAAVGIDWRPTSLPIHLIAEQRIGIAGVRGGSSVGIIGGIGPLPILVGTALEAYGQTGVIARGGGVEGYADGAARIARPIASVGVARLDLGLGAWGGAQRGAARLDVGPSAGLRAPVGRTNVRVALDWRHRIIGNASPGSGPALSIGTDF